MRLTYAGAREASQQDYIKFARAKGLSERRIVGVHLLKNILIPVVTVLGLEFGNLIAFSVVTETVFAWPGMGKLLIDSILLLDRPVVVAYLIVIVLIFLVINFVVDTLYSALDPRVRLRDGLMTDVVRHRNALAERKHDPPSLPRRRSASSSPSSWRAASPPPRSLVLALLVALAVAAPWITPQNPYDLGALDILDSRQPPGAVASAGFTMLLGTDGLGRDLYSAIVYGLRISLLVGVMSGVFALLIGMCAGLVAAYAGGRIEALIMRVVDLQLSFPAILVALMLVAVLGKGVDKVMLALVVVQWAYYARTVRASALVERRKEYVEAARGLALGPAASCCATSCPTACRR